MNFIKDITNIKKIRTEQLEKQKNNDEELDKIKKDCPDIVTEYLLFQRRLSRIQQNEMIDTNILDMVNVIYKHFNENTKIYSDFNQILNCNNPCECLKKLIY